jgi:predicted exporter
MTRLRTRLVVLAACAAFGADAPQPPQLELDFLLLQMSGTPGVLAQFHERKFLRLLEAPLESTGTLYFQPPDRFARVTQTPDKTRLVLDGGRMRFTDDAGPSDVSLAENPVARAFAENMLAIFRGDRASGARYGSNSAEGDAGNALTPKGAPLDRAIASIRMSGVGRAAEPTSWADGDSTQPSSTSDRHVFSAEEALAVVDRAGPWARRAARCLGRARVRARLLRRAPPGLLLRRHDLLPDARDRAGAISPLARGEAARTMVLTIGARQPARAVAAARELATELRAHPEVAWLREGPSEALAEDAYALYFPRRMYLLSADPERELPARLSDEGLAARARALRRELAGPASALVDRVSPEDPLGAFAAQTQRLSRTAPPLAVRDGIFTTQDSGPRSVPHEALAFDADAQRPLLARIDASFASLRAHHGDDLVLESAGANRFAVASEDEIRGDASRISSLSGVGAALLSLLFFRSLFVLGLAFVPAVAGLVVALAAGPVLFGQLDGLTLGFGASLIGVTIDYPTHYLILRSFAGAGESPWASSRRLAGSLSLAASTTIATFVGLALTSFPGFRKLGVFSAIGVAGALGATLWLLPDLIPSRARPAPISAALAGRLAAALEALRAHRRALALVPFAVVLLGAVALPRLAWNDDLSHLAAPPAPLRAEYDRVLARAASADLGRFVIALGDEAEQALVRSEAAERRLAPLVASGALDGVQAPSALLWSRERQLANLAALRASPNLAERIDREFHAAGFRSDAFAPFAAALASPPPPLELADLRASALAPLASAFALDLEGRTALITQLRGVRDPSALRAALADLPDVHVFDQSAFCKRDPTLPRAHVAPDRARRRAGVAAPRRRATRSASARSRRSCVGARQ